MGKQKRERKERAARRRDRRADAVVRMVGQQTIDEGRKMLEVVAYATETYWLLYASDHVAAKVGVGVVAMSNSSLLNLMMGIFHKGLEQGDRDPEVSNEGACG